MERRRPATITNNVFLHPTRSEALWRCQALDHVQLRIPVILLRRAAVVFCGLLLLQMPLRAAVLIHEYALRGTLEDNLGGSVLTAIGGQITDLGYVFSANQGIAFSSRSFTPSNYSVEFSFKLTTTTGSTKLLDFHHLTTEAGLYQNNGSLAFSPSAPGAGVDFSAGENVHVVLTREASTSLVVGYVNGVQQFSFVDSAALASPPGFSNKLNFFVSDLSNAQASGGTLNYLRIFNGALTGSDVSALFAGGPPIAVPEPSTFVLITLGGATLALVSRRNRKRP